MNLYNEPDLFAAAWLEALIKERILPPGLVDTRSIEDIHPSDLKGFVQCHFFAGIGVWAYALERAGWPRDRPVWTGSCPCQPFSAAGKRAGTSDDRHLWPAFNHLIEVGRPECVLGEQVASPDGLAWLDLVQADMEGKDYAFAALDLCAAGLGAPHIRQRLYWLADAVRDGAGRIGGADIGTQRETTCSGRGYRNQYDISRTSTDVRVADANNKGSQGRGKPGRERAAQLASGPGGLAGRVADAEHTERGSECQEYDYTPGRDGPGRSSDADGAMPTNGFWREADWLGCRDGKWRPVEPGTFPLVDGTANRVGRLRGYGNALVAPQAIEFIRAVMECRPLSS